MKNSVLAGISLAVLLGFAPAAMAQGTATPAPKAAAAKAETKAPAKAAKTEADNKSWVGLTIEDKSGKQLGTVVAVKPETGTVKEIQAKFGADTVKLTAKQVTKKDDKLIVTLTEKQIKKLPKVKG